MKILVTGGKGQLGQALKKVLPKSSVFVDVEDFDIVDFKAVQKNLTKIRPQLIIHTAAFTNVDGAEDEKKLAFQINQLGTRNLVKMAKKIGSFFIYISTNYVFGGGKKTAYKETDRPYPLSVYGKSKLAGEKETRKLKNFLIVRTAGLYGEGKNFVKAILELAKTQSKLTVVDDQKTSVCLADDLAKAIWQLIQKKKKGIWHIANLGELTWFDFAKKIVELGYNLGLLPKKPKMVPITTEQLGRPAPRPQNGVLDLSKAKKAGIFLREWSKALAEYLKNEAKK